MPPSEKSHKMPPKPGQERPRRARTPPSTAATKRGLASNVPPRQLTRKESPRTTSKRLKEVTRSSLSNSGVGSGGVRGTTIGPVQSRGSGASAKKTSKYFPDSTDAWQNWWQEAERKQEEHKQAAHAEHVASLDDVNAGGPGSKLLNDAKQQQTLPAGIDGEESKGEAAEPENPDDNTGNNSSSSKLQRQSNSPWDLMDSAHAVRQGSLTLAEKAERDEQDLSQWIALRKQEVACHCFVSLCAARFCLIPCALRSIHGSCLT